MKDIDFDELDKAVSSLMKGVPQSELETKQDKDDVKEIPSSPESSIEAAKWQPRPRSVTRSSSATDKVDAGSVNTPNEPIAQPSTPVESTTASSAPPAKSAEGSSQSIVPQRTSGRFMDIVPQSSVSKKQPSFARRRSQIINPASASREAASEETKDSISTEPVRTAFDSASSSSSWPDPLDLHENTKPTGSQEAPQIDADAAVSASSNGSDALPNSADVETKKLDELGANSYQSEISASTEVVSQQKPPATDFSSPFLTDAKVEKRPLGGTGNENTPEQDASASVDESTHSNSELDSAFEKETTVDSVKQQDSLPEELGSDIVAIESGAAVTQPVSAPKPTGDSNEALSKQEETTLPDSAIHSGPQVTSITQQYKIKSAEAPAEHAPIYDSHPEPLSHPAKTKSGWLTVLWIIGLVLLGAGGAAALYFLNIV